MFNVQGDVRQEQSGQEVVRQVVAHYGKLDILVNNAAGNFLCLLVRDTEMEMHWKRKFDNLESVGRLVLQCVEDGDRYRS